MLDAGAGRGLFVNRISGQQPSLRFTAAPTCMGASSSSSAALPPPQRAGPAPQAPPRNRPAPGWRADAWTSPSWLAPVLTQFRALASMQGPGALEHSIQSMQTALATAAAAPSFINGGWARPRLTAAPASEHDSSSSSSIASTSSSSSSTRPPSRLQATGSPSPSQRGPRHVIIFANGLFGSPLNWTTILEEIQSKPSLGAEVLLHPSQSNRRTDTFDGIDVCGQRLADEIRAVVAQHPSLERISVVGHSMGGLMLRYAIAQLFNPQASTVAGLAPAHFITLATPHLGCDAEGVAQVPFIGWAGPLLTPLLQRLSVPTAAAFFRRTGLQFFLEDPEAARGGMQPLLLRMTEDDPERGLFFYSALKSFTSRTAYANTGQDHLVGWPNSSLRFCHQLPKLPDEHTRAKGVVLEDDLMAAFDVRFKPEPEPQQPFTASDVPVLPSAVSNGAQAAGQKGEDASAAAAAAVMLRRLQRLPWRRIDVCFQGSPLAILSHNHIQVTRRWLNYEGRSVAIHLAEQLVALEAALEQLEELGRAPGLTRQQSLSALVKEEAEAEAVATTVGAASAAAPVGVGVGSVAVSAAVGSGGVRREVGGEGREEQQQQAGGGAGVGSLLGSWLSGLAARPHGRTLEALQQQEEASGAGRGPGDGAGSGECTASLRGEAVGAGGGVGALMASAGGLEAQGRPPPAGREAQDVAAY